MGAHGSYMKMLGLYSEGEVGNDCGVLNPQLHF